MADQEISKPERGGSRSSGRILGAGDCFDATSSMSYVFVVRVGNKIHIVHIEF